MRDQNHSTMCSFVFLPEEKKTHEKIPSFLIIKKKLIKITQNLFHQARRIILINSYSYVSIQCFINRVKYTQSSNKTTKSPIQQTYCYELRWIQQYQEWNYREIWKEKKNNLLDGANIVILFYWCCQQIRIDSKEKEKESL